MAKIIKNDNNNFWKGCEAIGTLTHYLKEDKLAEPLWKIFDNTHVQS